MRDSFQDFRNRIVTDKYIFYGPNQWCVHAGTDERGYVLTLQRHPTEKEPMIRVGCRYFGLKEARKHYVSKGRNVVPTRRATARRMLALIDIAVATAHDKGWLAKPIKFNATPRKVQR